MVTGRRWGSSPSGGCPGPTRCWRGGLWLQSEGADPQNGLGSLFPGHAVAFGPKRDLPLAGTRLRKVDAAPRPRGGGGRGRDESAGKRSRPRGAAPGHGAPRRSLRPPYTHDFFMSTELFPENMGNMKRTPNNGKTSWSTRRNRAGCGEEGEQTSRRLLVRQTRPEPGVGGPTGGPEGRGADWGGGPAAGGTEGLL